MGVEENDTVDKDANFKEYDEAFMQRREHSAPTDEVIASEHLEAENEDKSKGFAAKKIERELKALSQNYLNSVELKAAISPKVKINEGAMLVEWRDIRGFTQTDEVVEVSMNEISFHCKNSEAFAISKIIYPVLVKELEVERSELIESNGSTAVFRLVEFANNAEDWMTWVEKISRINKES